MNPIIAINPRFYRMFGDLSAPFYLVTNKAWGPKFSVDPSTSVILLDDYPSFEACVLDIPEGSHILAVSPDQFISSLPPEILGRRKLAVLASNSTPCDESSLRHFILAIENTQSADQDAFSKAFFERLNRSKSLEIQDPLHGTSARFDFRDPKNQWFFQGGVLQWGKQQIVPSGEISVLPLAHAKFDSKRRLRINGTIALSGYSILHNGRPSFERPDQQRLHDLLQSLESAAVICEVRDGYIESMQASDDSAKPALSVLEALFMVDSRYRIIWELGFGINQQLQFLPGNHAMNEVLGGDHGLIHLGLGLTPFTQYHLDIILKNARLLNEAQETLIGDSRLQDVFEADQPWVSVVSGACPCLET